MAADYNSARRSYVLVTGANSGIGVAVTKVLAAEGFHVLAGTRRDSVTMELDDKLRENVTAVSIDVTDDRSIAQAKDRVAEIVRDQGLFGLVNNAGIGVGGPVEHVEMPLLRRQFEVNVFGVAALTSALMPLLRSAKGRLINISSMAAKVPLPLIGPYSASKAALEALSDCLRVEIRRSGVTVSLIEPGVIDTPMHAKGMALDREIFARLPEAAEAFYSEAGRKRFETHETFKKWALPPERVAKVVVSILNSKNPRARYVVGTDARMFLLAKAVLPSGWRDRLLARLAGV